jgi:hypothetical protein
MKRGLFVETEKPIPVIFEDIRMERGYGADILVQKSVVTDN